MAIAIVTSDGNLNSAGSFTVDASADGVIYGGLALDTGSIATMNGATIGTDNFTNDSSHNNQVTLGTQTFVCASGHDLAPGVSGSQTFTQNTTGAFPGQGYHAFSVTGLNQTTPFKESNQVTYNNVAPGAITFDVDNGGLIILLISTNIGTPQVPAGYTQIGTSKSISVMSDVIVCYRISTATESTSVTPTMTGGSGRGQSRVWVYNPEPESGVVIDTVGGDGTIEIGENNVVSSGSGFEAIQGTGFITLSPTDNISDPLVVTISTVDSWAADSITFDVPSDISLLYGTIYMFVTNDSAEVNSAGKEIILDTPATNSYLIIREQNDLGVLKDVVGLEFDADQLEYQILSSGGGTVYIGVSGTVYIYDYPGSVPATDQIFIRLGDASDQTWSDDTLQAIEYGVIESNIEPSGISSTLSFGSTVVGLGVEIDVSPTGISSSLSFGTSTVTTKSPTIDVITENTVAQNATPDNQYTGVVDRNMDEANPTVTDPDAPNLAILNSNPSGSDRNQLIKFTGLSNIDSNVVVSSATLYIRSIFTDAGTVNVDLRQVLQDWVAGQSSWDNFSTGNAWGISGALQDGVDRVAIPESTTSINSSGGTWFALDCTSLVQRIIDGTITTDNGFLLTTDDVAGTIRTFDSSEGTDNQRPELVVEYISFESDIEPSGISSTLSFGTNVVSLGDELNVLPSGISSTTSFGNPSVNLGTELNITPSGVASTLSFGSTTVSNDTGSSIQPTGISSSLSFGTTDISNDAGLDISPSSIVSTLSFGTLIISNGTELDISPTGIASSLSFGTASVSNQVNNDINPSGISSTLSFGDANVSLGTEIDVQPSSIGSTLNFGSPTVSISSGVNISPSGIGSSLSFGSASISNESGQQISAQPIVSTLSFGDQNVSLDSPIQVSPSGIVSSLNFGTLEVTLGVEDIQPTGIESTLSFGSTNVEIESNDIETPSINSTLSFGTLNLQVENSIDVSAQGIASTLSIGSPSLVVQPDIDITVEGISSTLSFGNPNVSNGIELDISPSGISSGLSFGNATVFNFAIVNVEPTGIASTLSFGNPQVVNEIIVITVVPAPKERTFSIEKENRTYVIDSEDRTFIVRAGDEKMKEIKKDPQATLNYSYDLSEWLDEDDNISSYTLTISSGLTLLSDEIENSIITGVVSGGSAQGNESMVCTFSTDNGYSDQRTIIFNMGNR
ncbi:MAG: DNRLRE domain-containing protein [Actinomycetia bacterium]|nr:DNRLRE domain-containing protein [Actinomycetes bacterium]